MTRAPIAVVMDTNVVVSAAISKDGNPATIFEMLLLGEIQNYTTQKIIDEIKEVLQRPRIKKILNDADCQFIISTFEKFSEKVDNVPEIKVISEDPDDDKFLACATGAGATYIISGDEHLQRLKQFQDITIVSPAEFLEQQKRV